MESDTRLEDPFQELPKREHSRECSQTIKYGTRAKCPKCDSAVMVVLSQHDGPVRDGLIRAGVPDTLGISCGQCGYKEEWTV